MDNKEMYASFCEKVYVPIYSKPWWLDAVCGSENWDVWLYIKGNNILAAMPYYMENRGKYRYITKAPLTQNNGIIFNYVNGDTMKRITKQEFEEEVIEKACEYIKSLGIDVYEQQYHYDFSYWLPFYWNHYSAITRLTYVIEDTSDMEEVWSNLSGNYRKNIKKGQKNCTVKENMDVDSFYDEHENVFLKQDLKCPFSREFWHRLYGACSKHNACKTFYAVTEEGNVASVLFIVWDEKSVYHLLGGSIPEFQNLETYNALSWEAIQFAGKVGKKYDFEGSVIKRLSKSFRQFGGEPKYYYRIRKVFNPEILKMEYENQLKSLIQENSFLD